MSIFNRTDRRAMRATIAERDRAALNAYKSEALRTPRGFNGRGFIVDQSALTGVSYARASTPANGCGWIAAYNVLRTLKDEDEPGNIVRDVEKYALFGGKLGTNPFGIAKYLRKKGLKTRFLFTKKSIEKYAPNAKACICVNFYKYKRQLGAHYTAFIPKNGEYHFYNGYNPEKARDTTGPLMNMYNDDDFFRTVILVEG